MKDTPPEAELSRPETDKVRERLRSSVRSSIVATPIILLFTAAGGIIVARALGPSLLGVVTAISSVANTVTVFLDLGVSRSLPKILADVSMRQGVSGALRLVRKTLHAQLALYALCLALLWTLDATGIWNTRRSLDLHYAFLVLISYRVVISAIFNIQQGVTSAALRADLINRLSVAQSMIEPVLSVGVALVWQNPYLVVIVGLTLDSVRLYFLRRFGAYDLGQDVLSPEPPRGFSLLRRYAPYVMMTYVKFLFNRFVVGVSLIFWVLVYLEMDRKTIGNTGLAWSLAVQFWTIADIPLTQIQAPLLARLHAQGDEGRFRRAQRVMLGTVVFSSGLLLVGVAGFGTPLFGWLYGPKYELAVQWGMTGAMVALAINFFSLGNRALQQKDIFRPQIFGLATAAAVIPALIAATLHWIPRAEWPLGFLLSVLAGRGAFWLVTDLWSDARVMRWRGSGVRLRGLAAVLTSLALIQIFQGDGWIWCVATTAAALLLFVIVFRAVGGVGRESRRLISSVLPDRLKPLAAFC